jgi:Pvc16 N-terminal domain
LSNALAIAAVTSTLQHLLLRVKNPQPGDPPKDPALVGADVTAEPLHLARKDETTSQLNLFLYHTTYNAQLRNIDLPGQTRPGEVGFPPLALDLHYLLTAYGSGQDELLAHRLLGWAMSMLHDHAVLLPGDIKTALPPSDLDRQVERVRITPHPITTEEMSRLWTTFSTNYRTSVAYEASVVLIDSTRGPRAQLPALGRGVAAQGSTDAPPPPFPSIASVGLPNGQPAIRLGESVSFDGDHLDGPSPTASFSHPLLAAPLTVAATVTAGTHAAVTLPSGPAAEAAWPPGAYAVTLTPGGAGAPVTGAVSVVLAPRIVQITPAIVVGGKAKLDAQGALPLTVQFSPQVRPEQRLTLILGSRAVDADPRTAAVSQQSFLVPAAPLGRQFVRLRVDGIDSLVVDYGAAPPAFDLAQSVEVVP